MMTDAERTEAIERAYRIYRDPDATRADTLLAVALLEAREEVHTLQAKPPRMADDERERAYQTAQRLVRFDSSEPYERLVGEGLLAERAEADRLGSLLDSVSAFLTRHADAPKPRGVLADVLRFIGQHRRAK
jgi:hypothetical protein